jgi:hypothetical protein
VLEQLVKMGPIAADAAVQHLRDAPWYVIRNVLILVRRIGVWPSEWSPTEYAQAEDARVRREAIQLMLSHGGWRERAIVIGAVDTDRAVARAALIAAAAGCPRSAVGTLTRALREGVYDDELAPLAIRAVAASGTREGLDLAIGVALERTLFGRTRLAAPSADVIAAIGGLVAHWRTDPRAEQVLRLAAAHPDPEIRAACAAPGAAA